MLDTWAVLWEHCPTAKNYWLEHIQKETKRERDGNNDADFRTYFSSMVHLSSGLCVGRITYDVNWLTQRFFLGDPELCETLLCDDTVMV